MTKKQKTEEVKETYFEETEMVVETLINEAPPVKEKLKVSNFRRLGIKDRMYNLKNGKPLSRSIKAANIYYFDEKLGYERELKYCQNQKTCFVDEMKGDQRLEHIIFRIWKFIRTKRKNSITKVIKSYTIHIEILFTMSINLLL
jgi:hypothetical protein